MATDVLAGNTNMDVVNTQTRFGDDTIAPGLTGALESFYDKTESFDDRAKALELLTALRLGETIQEHAIRRPQTAVPPAGTDHVNNFLSPYQTSYNRDYPLKRPLDTVALRPKTSQGFARQTGPAHPTTYKAEFTGAPDTTLSATDMRPGSSSGARANNPHPSESFMNWKFPRTWAMAPPSSNWTEELTDDKINQVHKRLCQSTYMHDYMGMPQGFSVKSAFKTVPDWKENIPYTLDSVQRYSFQQAQQPEELRLPNTRYGSNTKKQGVANGTIPLSSDRIKHIRSRTTYDRHYNDNADNVTKQIRDISYKLGVEALQKYYTAAVGPEREMARRMLDAYGGHRTLTPVPPPMSPQQFSQLKAQARPPSRPHSRPPSQSNHNPNNRPASRPASHVSVVRSRTPASTPICNQYAPLPETRISPKISDAPYSPPLHL